MVTKKSVSFCPETLKQIDDFVCRGYDVTELSAKIREMIEDFSVALGRALKEVGPMFLEPEWNYFRDMLNGTLVTSDFHPVSTLLMQVADADEYDGLGAKWEVDVGALLEKVKGLSSFQGYAVLKSVDAWWEQQS